MRLPFRPPFSFEQLLAFLAARAIPGVEEVEAGCYRRTIGSHAEPGTLEVTMARDAHALVLTIGGAGALTLLDAARRVRRMFDLDADPLAISACLKSSKLLAPLVCAHPGLRVPGAWDSFETLVRAILGQQISVAAARTLSGNLVRRLGTSIHGHGTLTHLFPTPQAVANADLGMIGLPRARANALVETAKAVALDAGLLAPASNLEQLTERLQALPGVGAWTAHYVAMRAFNEPDAFPLGDLGLRKATGNISVRQLEAQAEAWRPWRAYAAMHLWTRYLEEVDHVDRAVAS